MPNFSPVNGQVKTPLRWYSSLQQQHRNTRQCREVEACDFALLSRNDAMPPFQLAVPTSVTAITSWKLYGIDDLEIANISSQGGLLSLVPFATHNYLIYDGSAFAVQIPQQPMYAVILAGGVSYYSEVFKPLCPAAAPAYVGEIFPLTIDGGLYSVDQAPDAPWSITRYAYLLTGMYSGGGAPTNQDWVFEGSQVANLTTGDLWVYEDGAWTSGRPPGEDYDLWYNQDAGTQHTFDGTNWLSAGPPNIAGVSLDYLGIFGRAYQPLTIGRRLDEVECYGRWVRFVAQVQVNSGEFRLEVWDGDGNVVAQSPQYGTDAGDATVDAFVVDSTYTLNIVAGVPGTPASMDVFAITGTCADDSIDCHMVLRWNNCGSIGTMFYEEGFVNEMILPSECTIVAPNPTLKVDEEEDSQGNRAEVFRRVDTEYTIRLGYVPWYVVDALAQVPLNDTVELDLQRDLGTSTLKHFRITTAWDDVGLDCYAYVEIKFQVDEGADASACCGELEPPCLAVCTGGAAGLEADGTTYIVGRAYLMADGTYATCTSDDPLTFGARTACPYRLARTSNEETGILEYFYYADGEWTPLAEILQLGTLDCESDPVVYGFNGNVWPRFVAQLQYATGEQLGGGGLRWFDLGEPYTNDELQRGVQFEAPADAVSIRLSVRVGNCEIGYSLAEPLPCSCEPFVPEPQQPGNIGVAVNPTPYVNALALSAEPIEAEYRVDGGAWVPVASWAIVTPGPVYILVSNVTSYTTIQYRARPLLRDCEWSEGAIATQ